MLQKQSEAIGDSQPDFCACSMFMSSIAMTAMTTAMESTAQYDDNAYMHTRCQTTSSAKRLSKPYTLVCGRNGYTRDGDDDDDMKQPHGQSNEKANNNMQGGAKNVRTDN